jgi:hypothetical protein
VRPIAADGTAQRPTVGKQVPLTDELVESLWAHALGKGR